MKKSEKHFPTFFCQILVQKLKFGVQKSSNNLHTISFFDKMLLGRLFWSKVTQTRLKKGLKTSKWGALTGQIRSKTNSKTVNLVEAYLSL
jgi:hypothetical protein